jgi:hypothetical protein
MLDIQDTRTVLRMFGIRLQLWDDEVPNAQDRQLWDAVKQQMPGWAPRVLRCPPSELDSAATGEPARFLTPSDG